MVQACRNFYKYEWSKHSNKYKEGWVCPKKQQTAFLGARCQLVWSTITKKIWDRENICHSKENSM